MENKYGGIIIFISVWRSINNNKATITKIDIMATYLLSILAHFY